MTEQDNSPLPDVERASRHGAGCDPAKRNQIMVGAKRAFMERGFDAAGVNDICQIAGISKSTLYVYFDSKEDLFAAIIEQERDRLFSWHGRNSTERGHARKSPFSIRHENR